MTRRKDTTLFASPRNHGIDCGPLLRDSRKDRGFTPSNLRRAEDQ